MRFIEINFGKKNMLLLIAKFFSGDFILAIMYASLSNISLLDLLVIILILGFVI